MFPESSNILEHRRHVCVFAVCVGVWAVYHPVGVGGGGENEFGLCGVVGGMTVILMLAYTMGLLRISHETADQAENRARCRVWKLCGYECEANIYSKTYTEGFF